MDMEDVLVWFIVIFLVGVLAFVGYGVVVTYQVRQFCWGHGFPNAHVSMMGESYCTKRVDQTDVTLPVRVIK